MNTTNDNMEGFVKSAVKSASIEKPSDNLLLSVMDKIDALSLEKNSKTVASQLITWKGWLVIGIIVITLFILLLLVGTSTVSLSYFDGYFDKISSINISFPISISDSISNIFLMGLLAFVFFFIIEISLITRSLKDT